MCQGVGEVLIAIVVLYLLETLLARVSISPSSPSHHSCSIVHPVKYHSWQVRTTHITQSKWNGEIHQGDFTDQVS